VEVGKDPGTGLIAVRHSMRPETEPLNDRKWIALLKVPTWVSSSLIFCPNRQDMSRAAQLPAVEREPVQVAYQLSHIHIAPTVTRMFDTAVATEDDANASSGFSNDGSDGGREEWRTDPILTRHASESCDDDWPQLPSLRKASIRLEKCNLLELTSSGSSDPNPRVAAG
jgi:hypothetical protein